MGEVLEKHVCCDCKKTKKRHKLVDFFRFKRKGEVGEDGEVKEEIKETGEGKTGESSDAAGSNIVKTQEKTSGFFWNMKREADVSEKPTKQAATAEELREDTKTSDLAAEVVIFFNNMT